MQHSKAVYLALGSNIGERQKNCEGAVVRLREHGQISVAKISKWYETKAECLPGETQADFINAVAALETGLSPQGLHAFCKEIEHEMGRRASPKKWQPRVIDLDILFFGDRILKTETLTIPHPLLHTRRFVLEPLSEIAPDLVHPVLGKTAEELLKGLS